MSTQKFKVGDRVKWRDYEGRARSGVIVETPQGGAIVQGVSFYVKEAQELQPGRWHESHLSLDVPGAAKATKFKIGDRVRHVGAPGWMVIQGHAGDCYTVEKGGEYRDRVSGDGLSLDVPEPTAEEMLKEEIGKNLRFHDHLYDVQNECVRRGDVINKLQKELTGAREQIDRQRRIEKNQAIACEHLSNRLNEEIGGRARERIAKEAALAAESLALESLREIAAALGDKSNLTAQGLREKIPALAAWKMKEQEAWEKQLKHASELLTCETQGFMKERQLKEAAQVDVKRLIEDRIMLRDKLMSAANDVYTEQVAKEAAQKELAKANDSLRFQRLELRKAMEDRSVEWLANEAAKKELADVRKDLADLRTISKRLAL